MISIVVSNVIDCGFEPWSGQAKDYKTGICCFSAKYREEVRAKACLLVIRIMCPSGVTCLPTDCCISELSTIKVQLSLLVYYKEDPIIIS